MLRKKILICAVPLLVAISSAALPAVCQASYHWYVNAVKLPYNSVKTELSTYGKVTLEIPHAMAPTPSTVTCNVIGEGLIWNVEAAKPGFDELTTLSTNK